MTARIIVGDALAALQTLDSESVHVCVTSPPYFQLRNYGVDGQIGMERTPAEFIGRLLAVFEEVKRVLRPDGLCFVNIGDSYAGSGKGPTGGTGIGDQRRRQGFIPGEGGDQSGARNRDGLGSVIGAKPKDLLLIPQRFAIAMQDAGWWVRSEIVWAKTSAMPESVRDRPTSAWEPIWMFAKSRAYFWDQEAVRQPNTEATVARHGGPERRYADHKPLGTIPPGHPTAMHPEQHHQGLTVNGGGANGANLRNVWLLSHEPSREEHYAAFPTEIPRRCILAGSRPGDTVLDPFLGSGTTALVADRLGRHAIGIELSPVYAEMAQRRLDRDAPMLSEPAHLDTAWQQQDLFAEATS